VSASASDIAWAIADAIEVVPGQPHVELRVPRGVNKWESHYPRSEYMASSKPKNENVLEAAMPALRDYIIRQVPGVVVTVRTR
jgi:hypothetical protein